MAIILFLLAAAATVSGANLLRSNVFTPLKNDDHPCVAENLKETHRYICNEDKEVICLDGYMEPEDPNERDLKNPCPVPICAYDDGKGVNMNGCIYGECIRPDVCACDVGWEGHRCDRCVALPGCEHGSCVDDNGEGHAFDCHCKKGDVEEGGETVMKPLWEGAFCDKPACPSDICHPKHGRCYEPRKCTCDDGWMGDKCMTCKPLQGCVPGQGKCLEVDGEEEDPVTGEKVKVEKPHTCECDEKWTGPLCDQPVCEFDDGKGGEKGCVNGKCQKPGLCVCDVGWMGESCDECVPYHSCPDGGTCNVHNQCICKTQDVLAKDDSDVCNKEYINGPMHSTKATCKNPCVHDKGVEDHMNRSDQEKYFAMEYKCLWSGPEPCEAIEIPNKNGELVRCYGDKPWSEADDNKWEDCEVTPGHITVNDEKAPGHD